MNQKIVRWIVSQFDKMLVGEERERFLRALKFDAEYAREIIRLDLINFVDRYAIIFLEIVVINNHDEAAAQVVTACREYFASELASVASV